MQTLLTVADNLRANLRDEEERMRQSNKHYDDLYNRLEDTMKSWSADKEKIRSQRSEIGMVYPKVDLISMWGCGCDGLAMQFKLCLLHTHTSKSL